MRPKQWVTCLVAIALGATPAVAASQPSGSTACAARSPAAAEAVKRRAVVALYYDLKLALTQGRVLEWRGDARARVAMANATHVAVNASHGFALDTNNRALRWAEGSDKVDVVLDDVAFLAAGDTGLLAIRCDGSLWQRSVRGRDWQRIDDAAIHAWVGDGADYYVDAKGRLYVSGKAHRGQYGNGLFEESSGWVAVADDAVAVYAHTGHALFLRRDGAVLGTGGNRFGPLGRHGIGDKATRWGVIFQGATGLGTGSSHSMAIGADGGLWSWGAADGLQPTRVLPDVVAATGGSGETLAITKDGGIWSWRVGQPPVRATAP